MKRDNSIEAFRVLLVFLVCLMHSIFVGARAGIGCSWLSNLAEWSVPGFIVISGWYGIKFSFVKVLKLYGISLYCAIAIVLFDVIVGGEPLSFMRFSQNAWHIATGHWFVNSYAVLMLLAPLVNTAFSAIAEMDAESKKKTLLAICLSVLVLVQLWSFSATLPSIGAFVPHYNGINKNSFVTMLAIYVLTRSIRLAFDDEAMSRSVNDIPRWLYAIVLSGSLTMASTGMGDINGPFALLLALGVFFAFRRMRLPSVIGKLSGMIAPSVFSIYLFHTNEIAWSRMRVLTTQFLGALGNRFVVYVAVAFAVFVLGLAVDIPRRITKYFMKILLLANADE